MTEEREAKNQALQDRFERIRNRIYPCLKPIESAASFQIEQENGEMISLELVNLPFLGGTSVFFAIDDQETFQLIQRSMVPSEIKDADLLQIAMKNLLRDKPFELFKAEYGGYALRSDPDHTSSYILFQPLWQQIAKKDLKEDLILSVPARDIILFVTQSDQEGIQRMKKTAKKVYDNNFKELTLTLFHYDPKTGKLKEAELE